MNISIFESKKISAEGLNIINSMFKIVQSVNLYRKKESEDKEATEDNSLGSSVT